MYALAKIVNLLEKIHEDIKYISDNGSYNIYDIKSAVDSVDSSIQELINK